ncbi:MAG: endo-1,4-beta-xylanase [Roseburia sp.]|nr:endo-1,4-beta-xylanase [Roseburia sp.]
MGNRSKKRVITMTLLFAMFSSCIGGAFANGADSQAAKKTKLKTKKVNLEVGKKTTIKITGKKKKAVYTFKASNKKITVTKKGVIRAVRVGTAKVTVKERYQKKTKKLGTIKVTVKKRQVPVTSQTPSISEEEPQITSPASSEPTGSQTTPPATDSGTSSDSGDPSDTGDPSESGNPSTSGNPSGDFTPVVYKNAAFETGTDGFVGRGGQVKITSSDSGYSGKCIYVTGRTEAWQGAEINMTSDAVPGATYSVTAWLKHTAEKNIEIKCSAETNKSYPKIASVTNVAPNVWTKLEGTVTVPESFSDFSIYFELPGSATANFYLDEVVITQTTKGKQPVEVTESILETYKDIFPYMGTCANYYGYGNKSNQLIDTATVAFIKKQFNSITLENEMKPDAVLGSSFTKITKEQAKSSTYNYFIPDNYTEESVPKLNFDTIDKTLEFCKNNGIKMRAHTLLWHQQTPSWFFAENYSGSTATKPDIMNARLEFFVRTVMKHVLDKEIELTGEAGSLVYAWDVVNEYLHRLNGPTSLSWVSVYEDLKMKPTYVKKAFEFAYDVLEEYGIEDKVTLFNNDYNTYDEVSEMIQLVNYINEGETDKAGNPVNICGGIGMQSHVDSDDHPTVAAYGNALEKFLATGLEVQITELDMTINFGETNGNWDYKDKGQDNNDQAAFAKEMMECIITKHKNALAKGQKGVTGVTLWGLYDACSWRSQSSPLLFGSSIRDPKPSFYAFLEAARIWGN